MVDAHAGKGTTYLDHAGTTLYAKSLVDAHHKDLASNLYGNPHSISPASDLSTQRVKQARLAVLNYFSADPEHFDVVFTANATAAIKIVADCFRDQDFDYFYHKDAHNSLVGIREVARPNARCLTTNEEVEMWIEQQKSRESSRLQLFAYPAQSNMTGYRPPYSWCKSIREACGEASSAQRTYVLLDAASYLTSGRLDLSTPAHAPDFICLSFYKIFGYPDLGALLVKKTALDVMTRKRYFGGGTVDLVTVIDGAVHEGKRQTLHDFLEDGTLPFHNILALEYAIAAHNRIFGTAENISRHTANVGGWLYNQLKALKHSNGMPVVELYEDINAVYGDPRTQGPIIAFNLLRSNGSFVGKSHLERFAIDCGFQLRTGSVCNPGGLATMLNLRHWELRRNYVAGGRCSSDIDILGAKPTGICRVSLGPMSTMSDVSRFIRFIEHFLVDRTNPPAKSMELSSSDGPFAKIITPIHGCSGFSMGGSEYEAYREWHLQWCIVDSMSGKVILSQKALKNLNVSIDVRSEQLKLAHSSGKVFALSLWDFPKSKRVDHPPGEQVFDVFESGSVNEWLTNVLGFPCSLGRYSREEVKNTKEATTCVVSNCGITCASEELLHAHYSAHSEQFLRANPCKSQRRSSARDVWRKIRTKNQSKQNGPDARSRSPAARLASLADIPSRPRTPMVIMSRPHTANISKAAIVLETAEILAPATKKVQ